MSILIVDDSADMRRSLKHLLKSEGFDDVVTANSGHQALQILGSLPAGGIDVVLMDISMPLVDGIEACRRVKAMEEYQDLPVIMVTGLADDEHLRKAFAAGAMDYITKPIKMAELTARLRSALALKQELECRKAREQELEGVTRQLQKANEALLRLSNIDELTAVANRRLFNQTLKQEWSRTMRNRSFLSLIMLDIDHFKAYNDFYGHQQGDACLQAVANALRGALHRPSDLLARYGGEEFAVILPNTPPDGAAVLAETFRSHVEELALPHLLAPEKCVTISVGVASALPARAWTPESLISDADHALYEAKHEGRNRIRVSTEVHEFAARACGSALVASATPQAGTTSR